MRKILTALFCCLAILMTACVNRQVSYTDHENETPVIITIDLEKRSGDDVTENDSQLEQLQTPDIVSNQDMNLYRNILDLYYENLYEKSSYYKQGMDQEDGSSNSLVYSILQPYCLWEEGKGYLTGEGFAFLDLNSDGVDELLIGWVTSEYWNMDEGYVFAIYTIVDGTATLAVEGAERCRYIVGKDGYLYQNGSDSAWESNYTKYKFSTEYKNFLEPIEEIYSYMNDEGTCSWEHITDPKDIGVIEYTPKHNNSTMDEDTALTIGETWMSSGVAINYTLFSEYGYEN